MTWESSWCSWSGGFLEENWKAAESWGSSLFLLVIFCSNIKRYDVIQKPLTLPLNWDFMFCFDLPASSVDPLQLWSRNAWPCKNWKGASNMLTLRFKKKMSEVETNGWCSSDEYGPLYRQTTPIWRFIWKIKETSPVWRDFFSANNTWSNQIRWIIISYCSGSD